jgi:hypothetical protein
MTKISTKFLLRTVYIILERYSIIVRDLMEFKYMFIDLILEFIAGPKKGQYILRFLLAL